MKSLVVCEKPSVAKSIAGVLGAKTRKDGSYEGGGYIISWCVGHLLELAEPQDYDEKYARWRYNDLPILPQIWKHTISGGTKKQLGILCDLMQRADIDCVINACDAGREGELIFRLVYEHAMSDKPLKRLWISSMEESAIMAGFRMLKDGADYDRLYQSALCRQRADWLVGLNFTRLFSVLYRAQLRVGRVQTPTLAMIVEREAKIAGFTKEPHYTVEITDGQFVAARERIKDKLIAEKICSDVDGKEAKVISVQTSKKSTAPPKLYDLTALQREANRLFGYTAAQTLNCVQNLYEQKLCTYPRTDSRYLTEDMKKGVAPLVLALAAALPFPVDPGKINASQVVNNAKVTDHHAIIPTPAAASASAAVSASANLSSLPVAERNILHMIIVRLISAVMEKHTYNETTITIECNGEIFTAKGKTIIHNGWKAAEQSFAAHIGKTKKDEEEPLPAIAKGYSFIAEASVREGFSQPPKHFTEDLLLAAMASAGAEDMPEDAERKGIGTPATRASIIENLVKSGFLERKGKLLLPTVKGVNLIKILPESVKSPLLTAVWEHQLKSIEHGNMAADDFITAIAEFVKGIVKNNRLPSQEGLALFPSEVAKGEIIGKCPRCGADVTEAPKGFFCTNRACQFGLFKENRFFAAKKKELTKEIASTLLTEGRIFMPDLYSERTGKTYGARIILEDKGEGYASFRLEFN